jgi:phosphoribosylamine--glycine ligase
LGSQITGIKQAEEEEGCLVFHAGTAKRGEQLVTAGGRVLNVVGKGSTLEEARERTYAGVTQINFDEMEFRTDIGDPR